MTIRILSFAAAVGLAQFVASAPLALAAAPATSAPALRAAAEPQAKAPQWKSREEYDAFQAMSVEKDPNKRIALAQAILQKYTTSDFKDAAYVGMMGAYQQLGDSAKAIDAAHHALEANPDNLDALTYLSFAFPYTFSSKSADAESQLSRADSDAKHGLEVLQKLQKPANVTDEQFNTYVKPKRSTFNTAVAFVAVQRKDYAAAIVLLKAAADDNPNDSLLFSLMGQSYLYSKPPDYDNAIWYLARSVALAQAAQSPNASALLKFYGQVYVNRHGSDAGENDIVTQAAASVNPPADFKVAPAPKHAATGNATIDAFYSWEDTLKSGGDTEKQEWEGVSGQPGLKGQVFEAPGVVDSVEKGSDSNTYLVRIDVAKEGTYNIEVKDSTQADAKYLSKGDAVRFKGTISAYTLTPSFVLSLDPGTINQEDLDSAKAKQQEKAKPKPRKRPAPPAAP
jgi:tetratricopeptide (TPR) repeat protein